MNAHTGNTISLSFNGNPIAAKDEMISLTDMWKAAGSDFARQPSNWLSSADARRFIDALDMLVPGNSGVQSKRGGRGVGGSTMANWQIALAYAKYLSPEFHMWCNTVVRERMEGRSVSAASLPPDILEMLRRDDGMSKTLVRKVTGLEQAVEYLAKALATVSAQIHPSAPVIIRHGKSAGQILAMAGYRVKLKGLSAWAGNRLQTMGCRMPDNTKSESGLTTARLFDPDKALYWIDNGGRSVIDKKIEERRGQTKLRIV